MSRTLEDDILSNEFPGNETNIMDAEVIYQRPKAKRPILPAILVGGFVLSIGLGGLYFNEIKSLVLGKATPTIENDKPATQSAELPDEISIDITKAGGGVAISNESAEPKTELVTQNLQASSESSDYKVPGDADLNPITPPMPNYTAQNKTSLPITKPSTPEVISNPVISVQAADQERYEALDTKIRDLTLLIGEISKKLDTVALEKKENAPKSLPVAKASISDTKKTYSPSEVTKSMKDLHIVALLSDGVVFEGDIAVSIGQYAKHLKGKIISINAEQNIITTDSKIFKVL